MFVHKSTCFQDDHLLMFFLKVFFLCNTTLLIVKLRDPKSKLLPMCAIHLEGIGLEELPSRPPNEITFDYDSFNKENGRVTVGWSVPENNTCKSLTINLQGFPLSSLQSNNLSHPASTIPAHSSDRAVIPSSKLRSGTEDLYYRIVAVFDNESICENSQSDERFYRFTGEGNQELCM